jgi:hypothetical protein
MKSLLLPRCDCIHCGSLCAALVSVATGCFRQVPRPAARGHMPNIFGEMGLRTEWRYNRTGFVKQAVITSALLASTVYLMRRHRR